MATFNNEREAYRLESPDLEETLVALRCEERDGGLSYFDLSHQRFLDDIVIASHDEDTGVIILRDSIGRRARFTPLSLSVYNSEVKSELTGEPEFDSREEMADFLYNVPYW